MPLFMGKDGIVGSGFITPITPVTVAVILATVAHDVPHDALPFETEQLIPPYPEDRAEWGSWCWSACSMRWAVMSFLRTVGARHFAGAKFGVLSRSCVSKLGV